MILSSCFISTDYDFCKNRFNTYLSGVDENFYYIIMTELKCYGCLNQLYVLQANKK